MMVSEVQHYLSELIRFLESCRASSTLLRDLQAFRDAIGLVSDKSVKQFAEFLAKAEEFERTGQLAPRKQPRITARPPRQPKAIVNLPAIIAETKYLYDHAADPSITMEIIEGHMLVVQALNVSQLKEVAEGLGLKGMKGKKKLVILSDIRRMIIDRRGSHQRAGMIHPIGATVTGEPVTAESVDAVPGNENR